jgi:hypothetical protein
VDDDRLGERIADPGPESCSSLAHAHASNVDARDRNPLRQRVLSGGVVAPRCGGRRSCRSYEQSEEDDEDLAHG